MIIHSEHEETVSRVMVAIRFLAACCDRARNLDGEGFSADDAPLGHELAAKEIWSVRESAAAAGLTLKYARQLAEGNVDCTGFREYMDVAREQVRLLLKEGKPDKKLKKSDIVIGEIRVERGRIVIDTNYNGDFVKSVRRLIGRSWAQETKTWSADLCQENALAVDELAAYHGLKIERSPDWDQLPPAIQVEIVEDDLVFRGVNFHEIRNACGRQTGDPIQDEEIFDSFVKLSFTSFKMPLTSWNIQRMALWISPSNADKAASHPLAPVREKVLPLLAQRYHAALEAERSRMAESAGLNLSEAGVAKISALLPIDLAEGLMPHQWVAVQAILERPQLLLADQQGLGKTVEILAGVEAAGAFPALVVCPAIARLNWAKEAARWLPNRRVSVLGVPKRNAGADPKDADIVIVGYELFGRYFSESGELGINFEALVADESQYLKGHDSQRSKDVKDFCKRVQPRRVILATGTPLMNRPSEVLTQLNLLPSVLAMMGGFAFFAARYCRATLYKTTWSEWWDYSGAANIAELNDRLRATCLIRREKATVLPDLAAKAWETIPVELSNRAEYDLAESDLQAWLKTKNKERPKSSHKAAVKVNADGDMADDAMDDLDRLAEIYGIDDLFLDQSDRHHALRLSGILRQLAGKGKIDKAVEWVECHRGEKVVIFAYHKEVQQELAARLGKGGLTISGDQTPGARQETIEKFQNDPSCEIVVCSIKAAQTAITLTAARRVLFVELDWTPAALEQAEDRVHRIGQIHQVLVTRIKASSTLDDRMLELVDKKRKIAGLAFGSARFGYKKDGTPRKRKPGLGRPRLSEDERVSRRRKTKASWQAKNSQYMRDYMRERRRKRTPVVSEQVP